MQSLNHLASAESVTHPASCQWYRVDCVTTRTRQMPQIASSRAQRRHPWSSIELSAAAPLVRVADNIKMHSVCEQLMSPMTLIKEKLPALMIN